MSSCRADPPPAARQAHLRPPGAGSSGDWTLYRDKTTGFPGLAGNEGAVPHMDFCKVLWLPIKTRPQRRHIVEWQCPRKVTKGPTLLNPQCRFLYACISKGPTILRQGLCCHSCPKVELSSCVSKLCRFKGSDCPLSSGKHVPHSPLSMCALPPQTSLAYLRNKYKLSRPLTTYLLYYSDVLMLVNREEPVRLRAPDPFIPKPFSFGVLVLEL